MIALCDSIENGREFSIDLQNILDDWIITVLSDIIVHVLIFLFFDCKTPLALIAALPVQIKIYRYIRSHI